ncbi:hypothetical protein ABIE66_005840 [Peribacillus sp. B2I2]|uniref:hypothetical protein n=1 Tax=Peribacillus sp. B2I2 TaxID=3156468 RepID=UPI0035180378
MKRIAIDMDEVIADFILKHLELAKSMKSKNKGKGVTLDMTWALVYSVKSR